MLRLKTFSFRSLLKPTAFIFSSIVLSACNQKSVSEKVTVWPTVKDCDLHHQTCSAINEGQTVSLKISPDPIPIAIPLGIEIFTKNIAADKIELDISGTNMYMGYNRITLIPDEANTRYIGSAMLAFCTTGEMQWQITILIHQKDGTQIQVPYLLETQETQMH